MDFEPLFTPFSIGSVTLRNRFVMAPMQKHMPPKFIPTEEQAKYYEERIRGGIALIVSQGTTMDHPTTQSPYARLYPPAYEGWRCCADAVRNAGGHIIMQLWHEGAHREGGYGPSGLSPAGKEIGHTLTKDQIHELIDVYATSARAAESLGFAGVEMHYGQGYLLGQFLHETSNRRDDEYGGDFSNRIRFGLEVARAIRASVSSEFLLGLRTSAFRNDGSLRAFPEPEYLESFLLQMREAGVTHFNSSSPRFFTPEYPSLDTDLSYAGWIKKLTGMPVIGVGSVGMSDVLTTTLKGEPVKRADNFEELLRRFHRGDFDLVGLGRTIYTDPQWPTKLREHRFDDMKQVITAADMKKENVVQH